MPRLLCLVVPCWFLLTPAAVFAQRDAKVPDPDPELERKTFVLPDGFEVNLFAADPMLAKPIQMNFDSKGRLWVAASEVYPQIKPGQKANDKVLILEDTDNDGKADKTTVFADGLLIPTAVEPDQHGGAWVADSTDMVHFSEPGKDGKATKKRIVLSGFGTEDTHHILHTFRTGPDCRLYMSQSIYIHSHIETPHGVRRLNAGGIWQFEPETEKLEVFARGWVNSWGTAWMKSGATFATDGAGGEGINYVVPGGAYVTARDVARILPGLNPGSPKYCGLEVVSGRHLPDDWQQNLITNDFRGHRVCRYVVQEDGAGFVAKEQKELIKSNHPAFRPIDVKMGPDGAIYIADWYNPIIQHGEVDFRDERRDHTHGRIWRITCKGRDLVKKPKISGATAKELFALLKSPEDWTRSHARRELASLPDDKYIGFRQDFKAEMAFGPNPKEQSALELLYVELARGEAFDPAQAEVILAVTDPQILATGCRIVGDWGAGSDKVAGLLAPFATHNHPRVRLEAVRALARVKGSASAIASALDKPVDRWLDYAIWLSLRETKDEWLPKVKDGSFDFGGDPKKLVFALRAAGEADVTKPLFALLAGNKLTPEKRLEVMTTVAGLGGPDDLAVILRLARAKELSDTAAATVVAAVEEAVRVRKVKKPAEVATLLNDPPAELRPALYRLVGHWRLADDRAELEQVARLGSKSPLAERVAAIDALAEFGGDVSKRLLLAQATLGSEEVRRPAIAALATLDLSAAATAAAKLLERKQPVTDLEPLFAVFTGRKGGTAELAKAIAVSTLTPDVARIGVRLARSTGQPDQKLIDALTAAGKLTEVKRAASPAELKSLLADVTAKGDVARGEKVYRRAEMNCLKCHAIAGAGGRVGPDMTSIGASAQVDYLVESLLHPNAKVKEGYNSVIVETLDGRSVSGVKVRENGQELVVRDAEDREVVIPKADKPDVRPGKSLMPEGLTDSLTHQEFIDLVRFLSELGKGEYLAQPGTVVRRWETVLPVQPLFTAVTRDRLGAVATRTDLQWAPAYSTVNGDLPVEDLAAWKVGNGPMQAVARFQLDVTTAGKAKLVFADPTGLQVWLDGTPLTVQKEMTVDLPAGRRTVTVHLKPGERKAPLRVELGEVKDSTARVAIVGGK